MNNNELYGVSMSRQQRDETNDRINQSNQFYDLASLIVCMIRYDEEDAESEIDDFVLCGLYCGMV